MTEIAEEMTGMRLIIAAIVEILGLFAIAAGLWMLAPWIGVLAGGLGLIIAGLAIDPPKRTP